MSLEPISFVRQIYGVVEFYAGLGNNSRCAKLAGIPTASLDLLYHTPSPDLPKQNYMDIVTDAGLSWLVH